MADYYPVLTRAIAALENNTADARRAVYERARQAIVKQLRSYDPPLSESEITRERLGLEEAVRKIEAENRTAQQAPKPPPPISARVPPVAPPPGTRPVAAPAAATPSPAQQPTPPASARMGGEGLTRVHAAAAAAASLGAATANAQAAAGATRAAFEPPPRAAPPPRVEPSFDRPRVPGPVPPPRTGPAIGDVESDMSDDPNPHLREPEDDDLADAPRGPQIGGIAAVIVLLGLGIGSYLARDQIAAFMGVSEPAAVSETGPKTADRVQENAAPPPPAAAQDPPPAQTAAAPSEPAPAVVPPPADAGSLVSQRAILYDEAPDQKGGASFNGAVVWRTEPIPDKPSHIQLVGEATVAERGLTATVTFTRNLDETLSASHLIEIRFDTTADFQNGGINNVPGILFKPTEQAGGSALKGMSVKVTKNLFWIGLEKSPADREQNMQAIRTRGWIDVPILYENGRRAVLTLEKGPPGERAFETAFSTWDAETTATPAQTTEPSPPPEQAPALPPIPDLPPIP